MLLTYLAWATTCSQYPLVSGMDTRLFVFDTKGVTVHLKSGQELLVPPVGKMYFGYGHRLVSETEQACAVIVPGLLPTTNVDINAYHRSAARAHPRLLRETAKQQGVTLKPGVNLLPCFGCSSAKGISASVQKTTLKRSDKKLGRFFCRCEWQEACQVERWQAVCHHIV